MAKISARGDREAARWTRTRDSARGAPHTMVLTERGRLLYKALGGDGYTIRRTRVTRGQADAQAAMFRMERGITRV